MAGWEWQIMKALVPLRATAFDLPRLLISPVGDINFLPMKK
ncbi:MAG: hypothetical protein ACI8YQ_003478 [Polaribacter sp.]